ncbi:A-kinase anchor protein 13 [Protopterus annectens]|uniref:A-kinase anchor protein 13 n=1 Tax=Protopterus annectens TaxID=7888 RepID=UPI001CFBEBA5|nr:A-kinase anchor protein 13 [Protopterus annectens]
MIVPNSEVASAYSHLFGCEGCTDNQVYSNNMHDKTEATTFTEPVDDVSCSLDVSQVDITVAFENICSIPMDEKSAVESVFNPVPDKIVIHESMKGVPKDSDVTDVSDIKAEDEVDFQRSVPKMVGSTEFETLINRGDFCSIESYPDQQLLDPKHSSHHTECKSSLEDGLTTESTPSLGASHNQRRYGSDSELFPVPCHEEVDESIFVKAEEEPSAGEGASSSSSTDDSISFEVSSFHGSSTSLPLSQDAKKEDNSQNSPSSCEAGRVVQSNGGPAICETEEEKDSITDVPLRSSILQASIRSISPFRRHSWGPGKNAGNAAEVSQGSSVRSLGDVVRRPPTHRRSNSWCPSNLPRTSSDAEFKYRSYSLEGLAGTDDNKLCSTSATVSVSSGDLQEDLTVPGEDSGSFISLTEEDMPFEKDDNAFEHPGFQRSFSHSLPSITLHNKSMTQITSQPGEECMTSSITSSGYLSQGSLEDGSGFARKDQDGKGGNKVGRTFSYLRNKMTSSKKSKEEEEEKDKEKTKEKDKDSKEKDKKGINGHAFSAMPLMYAESCQHCSKPLSAKETVYSCTNCKVLVHKCCREKFMPCAEFKMKQPKGVPSNDTSSLPVVNMRNKGSQPRERPRSAIYAVDETAFSTLPHSRRSVTHVSLSKSVSIQNIPGAGMEESLQHSWKYLSQSIDSLHKIHSAVESVDSFSDEGTDVNEGQLMGEFDMDSKELEAESWSQAVDGKFVRQQKKEVVKRQDVIYELIQTEMHYVRTLKIMSDVYSKGMINEVHLEAQTVDKIFPCLETLLDMHAQFFARLMERKKESAVSNNKNFLIKKIGDILLNQFSGASAEEMKKTYGKFCGHHNEAVNHFKELYAKEKNLQAFIRRKMSSTLVRRMGIQECILTVTQRITKYPVLLQRILQYTKENEEDYEALTKALSLLKEVIAAVDSKVNEYEKKSRLNDIYSKTDSKTIMRMKTGQMFARQDLIRRKLIHDGPLILKSATGRLKDVLGVLLSDVLVFLQEKDQKYVFASLDHKATVMSLKRLIVREVAHEEKGLFLISVGDKNPEMVEVYTNTKEERNNWIQLVQQTMSTIGKDEDEGIPSESEEDRRLLEARAREMRDQLLEKDKNIMALLEEKEKIFRELSDSGGQESPIGRKRDSRKIFRATTEDTPKGEPLMKQAFKEVETLHFLVSRNIGRPLGTQLINNGNQDDSVGPVTLPRRAETFAGFDSHQMHASKNDDKDGMEEVQDLRRTESDGVLKKGGASHAVHLKRTNEQFIQSILRIHEVLTRLQAAVIQQDSFVAEQKLVMNEKSLVRQPSRPNSLIEQEKQRNLEKQRQELANLQKQQAQHLEEKQRREKELDAREKQLKELEVQLKERQEQLEKRENDLSKETNDLKAKKEEYQLDLERLRTSQKLLDREREQLEKEKQRIAQEKDSQNTQGTCQHNKVTRLSSAPPEDLSKRLSSGNCQEKEQPDTELSVSSKKSSFYKSDSKQKRTLLPAFHLLGTANHSSKTVESQSQPPHQGKELIKSKDKKGKKKKKDKGPRSPTSDAPASEQPPPPAADGEEIYFC